MRLIHIVLAGLSTCLLCFCGEDDKTPETTSSIHFTSLPSSETKINFNNMITENDSVNLIQNAYAYMGSGVGVGDFNNDGLPDVFLGANQRSSKLYINKGGFEFEDATEKSGLETSSWITGVSIVDINNDGYDDIYLCVSVSRSPLLRTNKLYINDGKLGFTEQAAAYGLADTGYSTQAVFLDYDKDGDLDMYLVNHLMDHWNSNNIVKPNLTGKAPARDKLYRNNGISKETGHPVFEDVSFASGIREDGYGLGVVVTDINNDGWPDLYVSNDYLANDLLWINNKNGTFTNRIASATRHQSYSSMGVDAGDINNDGLADIISLDMLPEENNRQKMMYSFLNYDRYVLERQAGYEPQFIRNMLQLNNGTRMLNDTLVPFFSEIGQYAGISETDWSWSVLMADFDNDGFRDIHITNGLGRDMINSDFITYYANSVKKPVSDPKEFYRGIVKKLDEYGTVELNNYCYRNNGNLEFTDVSAQAGIGPKAISNGCAYADLDNDGDLDLIVNNFNKEAFILRNDARNNIKDNTRNFISVQLAGDGLNKKGIGARVSLFAGGQVQTAEQNPVRGYLSSMDNRIYFGIGSHQNIDSVNIVWPDGKQQVQKNIAANTVIHFKYNDAVFPAPADVPVVNYLFNDITGLKGIDFKHKESFFYDYGYQQLLPQKYSQQGSFIAEGDINGDGLMDFFVGGAKDQSGRFFIQQPDGSFIKRDLVTGAKPQEDLGCLLFDADGDNDLDLIVNSGSIEDDMGSANYLPRLYKNDGRGNFSYDKDALPQTIFTSAQCVSGADYDGDGDIDIFIGGRISPKQYPVIPESYLLRNDGGKFSIVTQEVCAALQYAGMVTDAEWSDLNNDNKPDLIIAGEWMPVRIFMNDGQKLNEIPALKNMNGQWRSIAIADIDKDGDPDIVAGNLGSNNRYKASAEYPIRLFAKDLDGNGSIDPVMAYYIVNEQGKRELYPAINREQFAAQVPLIKKKFLYNKDYAGSNMEKVLSGTSTEDILQLYCNQTKSVWLENKGSGEFIVHELPAEAQFAPVNSIVCADADKDGNIDILIAGNEYQTEVMTGRYDASYGWLLKGDGKGNFKALKPTDTGLIIDGDVKDLKLLNTVNGERVILAAVNDEQLKTFRLR